MTRRVARIALIEDQPEAQKALAEAIQGDESFRLASTHPSAEAALRDLDFRRIDLAIVDLVLPRMSGIDLTRELKRRKPGLPILVLTAFNDAEKIFGALAAGADGYVLKSAPKNEWRTAIRQSIDGGSALTPSVARKVIQHFRNRDEAEAKVLPLTPRQLAVLREVAAGRSYKEAGDILGISAETVRVHIRDIKEKLRVSSRGELVATFLRH